MINKLKRALGFFILNEKINAIQSSINELKEHNYLIDMHINSVKSDTTLCRFTPQLGKENITTRYRVSDVVELLLEHHGLTIETIPAKDSCVKLVAKEEPKE